MVCLASRFVRELAIAFVIILAQQRVQVELLRRPLTRLVHHKVRSVRELG